MLLSIIIIKRKLRSGLKIELYFLMLKTIASAFENKTHIFVPPSNILYIFQAQSIDKSITINSNLYQLNFRYHLTGIDKEKSFEFD